MLSGKILSSEKETVDFAKAYLKKTHYSSIINANGIYHLKAPAGDYTLVITSPGYKTEEKQVKLIAGERTTLNITITPHNTNLKEVIVSSTQIDRLKNSAYNAISIGTKKYENTTQTLSDALTRAPGMKIRESGGVGSDLGIMMDGFSGNHVKILIDGVPQEGVGKSFGLNNIPINYADRIEVYRGVVPVGFGTDALGGVINIVTKKARKRWFLDASYSYGSFNTHQSHVNFGQTLKNGFTYEINAFQNYSDNDYSIETEGIRYFNPDGTVIQNKDLMERVKRFHDTYHNEAIVGRIGLIDKKWADRLMLGFTYSHMYKDIQTGVQQQIVFGEKHQKGYSLIPSLEYSKRNLFTKGLNVILTAHYNRNIENNVDTSAYEFNWHGDKHHLPIPGEQTYQNTRSYEDNWNGTFTATYHLDEAHLFTFNHVISSFQRNNKSLLNKNTGKNAIPSLQRKNISGLSYRLMPAERWNATAFGKYYNQYVEGPIAVNSAQDVYTRTSKSVSSFGYGIAGTYLILRGLQAKLSYEKTFRLPNETEMFGDENLETGNIGLKPEKSHNVNFNLSYSEKFGMHSVYVEGGLIFRDSKDYIHRNIQKGSGGITEAAYLNYARVKTKGYNISVRYGFADWLSLGGNFTQMDVRDNMKKSEGGAESVLYGYRMNNVPYQFANSDVTFYWRNLGKKGNLLTVTYDNLYMHSFPLFYGHLGEESRFVVPSQFSHNLTFTYGMQDGRYNLSFECQNFTDEKVYDNYKLQKAGRSFYGTFRIYFGN